MIKFQKAYKKLSRAFKGVPFEELGISDEVKEQVFVNCTYIQIIIDRMNV